MENNKRTRVSRKTKNKKIRKQKILIKKFLILSILLLIFIFIVANFKNFYLMNKLNSYKSTLVSSNIITSTDNSTNVNNAEEIPEDTTISMSVIGDIMCHNTQYTDAYNQTSGTYDFSYVFENIKYYLQTADLSIGNLETTFAGAGRGYSSYPTFNTPEILAKNLKTLGLDVLTTANNHSLDKGYSGVESTIKFLDEADISHTGTYTSAEEQNKILTKNIKGIKFAFLSYTYGTNGIPVPSGKDYCINLIDKDLMLKQINLAKKQNPDVICVSMHWGTEYKTVPTTEQNDLADFLFNNGVDIVLGSHPHVLEKMEKRTITLEDGSTKDGFVIYSLGNFMSGQVKDGTKDSIILKLKITKNGQTDKISIDDVSYTPIYMYSSSSGKKNYKILDIEKSIYNYDNGIDTSIGQTTYNTLKSELEKMKKIIGTNF